MKKKSIEAILVCFASTAVISFLALIILQIKVGLDAEKLVKRKSILTETNAMNWAAQPGLDGVQMIHQYQVFDYRGLDNKLHQFILKENIEEYNQHQMYKNRTYIPSSPGYVTYMPESMLIPQGSSLEDPIINQINLVAAQNFYQGVNEPLMAKLPLFMKMHIQKQKSLVDDFLPSYYTYAIYQLFVKNQDLVQETIFNLAGLSQDTSDQLWQDYQYGWGQEETFRVWVKLLTSNSQKESIKLMQHFDLTSENMNSLVGPASTIRKFLSLIISTISEGIRATGSTCDEQICSSWELACAQWGSGYLTSNQAIPPLTFDDQTSFRTFNATIPEMSDGFQLEYFLTGKPLQFSTVQQLLQENVEKSKSLFCFTTSDYLITNIDNPNRIQYKLGLTTNVTAMQISEYIRKQLNWLNRGIEQQLSYDVWRYITQMTTEGANLLINGLHAKALFYKKLKCGDLVKNCKNFTSLLFQ